MESVTTRGIREGVSKAYSEAAEHPEATHPFPVGRAFAESVGYPAEVLDEVPEDAVNAFAGVSNISVISDIPEGSHVLDLGCGAGLDSLIASRMTGFLGEVIGIDFSDSMLARARAAAVKSGLVNLKFVKGEAENIPVPNDWADVVLINGIFNLNTARSSIFHELARVSRSGGTVFAAELILAEPLPPDIKSQPGNWFA